jgi:hypothetical protein
VAPLGTNILANEVSLMLAPLHRTLRLDASNGAPVNEYRVHGNRVEFRILTPDGRSYRALPGWRALSPNEVLLHFNLKTAVAGWLEQVFGWNAPRGYSARAS